MTFTIKTVASVLAGSAIVVVLSMPVSAAGLGVSASVGGSGGVNAGVGANGGGGGGGNAGVGASVGGSNGVNAGLGTGAGGSNGNAGLSASIGGSNGIGANANVGGTSGITAGLGANVGDTSGIGIGGANPSSLSNPTNPSQTSLSGTVAQMSNSQVVRMKKRCVDVLSNEGAYDRDLRQLCLLIARR
ncbi:hypothetical protein [Mesorhizobium sp. B4-1-4]|uniref:hypothetical protein n=1 Tax=Mesorhizobium sp. B4-1-4 TaxID=2589888 RepID=UPI0011266066|nr:hypothetical protein [Mesorhizobium sp. B4-1-4]UCI34222.1 hypothetical protein FJW03_12700 [Mesorhizobium sp. B4-1-4]